MHALRNTHIIACEEKMFGMPTTNAAQSSIRQRGRHTWTWSRNVSVLWAENGLRQSVKLFCRQTNWNFELFFGKHGCNILCTKEEQDHPTCDQLSVQKPALVPLQLAACTSGKAPSVLYVQVYCSYAEHRFFSLAHFSKTMQNHILQLFELHEVQQLPSSVPTRLQTCWK